MHAKKSQIYSVCLSVCLKNESQQGAFINNYNHLTY